MDLHLTALHDDFGVEVHGIDLRRLGDDGRYPDVRAAFEEHSVLLFRGQSLDDAAHLALGSLFGPIEDRSLGMAMGTADAPARPPRMDNVSNRLADGTISAADDLHTLNLIGNQLWHTDSTFLPVPALANILAARVLSSTGGETEFVSTRVAWREMPEELRRRIRGSAVRHRAAHSRRMLSPELVRRALARWTDQVWPAIWTNPVNGHEALYLASHACGIEGMADDDAQALIDELIAFCTRPQRVYTHHWLPGDVLIWDERATMHRGRPWPYEEERTLASICVSARARDGLERVSR